jgi:hypothetical protein
MVSGLPGFFTNTILQTVNYISQVKYNLTKEHNKQLFFMMENQMKATSTILKISNKLFDDKKFCRYIRIISSMFFL